MRDPGRSARWVIRWYPKAYRDEYGDQIEQTVADMVADAPTALSRWAVFFLLLVDLPKSVAVAQLQSAGGPRDMPAPRYIQRSSMVAVALVVPFFAAIAAQAANHAVTGHDLSTSWLWSTPVLVTWVLVLPTAALLVSVGTYLIYTVTPAGPSSLMARATDVRRTWPVLVPAVVALGVVLLLLFHDSAHCWTQNPIDTFTHVHQTWSCTSSGFLGGK